MTVTMALWNMLFTPFFMGVGLADLMPLLPLIILFNVVKAALNSVVALLLYKLIPRRLLPDAAEKA